MKTIPDAIDDIKEAWRKIIDTVYKVSSNTIALKLSSWAWQKKMAEQDRDRGLRNLLLDYVVPYTRTPW